MQNELPPQDPKTVWQNQRLEATQMSIEEIRSKARSFERKIRRRNLREYLASAFIAAAFAFFAWRFPLPVMRVGFIAVAVGALCFAFELDRRGSLQTEPKELGTTASLDFYIRQLERQRNLLDQSWKRMLWLVPGMIVLIAGAMMIGPIRNTAPFIVLAVLWTATWLWMMLRRNKRKALALRREIDELAALRSSRKCWPATLKVARAARYRRLHRRAGNAHRWPAARTHPAEQPVSSSDRAAAPCERGRPHRTRVVPRR